MNNKKILIAAPITTSKQYSVGNWFQRIATQSYTNYDVLLCVNGKGDQSAVINDIKATNWTDVHRQTKTAKILHMKEVEKLTLLHRLTYAREAIRLYFEKHEEYSHILWLDTDTIPLADDFVERLFSHNVEAVSGLYFYKSASNLVPVMVDSETGTNYTIEKINELMQKDMLGIAPVVGFGCLLMNRRVAIDYSFNYNDNGKELGDDYIFCYQMHNNADPIYFDPVVLCKHLGHDDWDDKIGQLLEKKNI